MIIVCPSCSDPYQVENSVIAPLVQVACPSCQDTIILDFEAANDPSLIEIGMGSARSYPSESSYRAAVGESAAQTPAVRQLAVTESPTSTKAAALQPKPVVAPSAPVNDPSTVAGTAAPGPTGEKKDFSRASRPADTSANSGSTAEAPVARAKKEPRRTIIGTFVPPSAAALTPPASPPPVAPEADISNEIHTPPHSPPPPSAPRSAGPEETTAQNATNAKSPTAETSQPTNDRNENPEEPAKPRENVLTLLLVGLIVIGAAVAGLAYVETGNPNPIPFVQPLIQNLID